MVPADVNGLAGMGGNGRPAPAGHTILLASPPFRSMRPQMKRARAETDRIGVAPAVP